MRKVARPTLIQELLGGGGSRMALLVLDLETAEVCLSEKVEQVFRVAFSPNGRFFACHEDRSRLRVWTAQSLR